MEPAPITLMDFDMVGCAAIDQNPDSKQTAEASQEQIASGSANAPSAVAEPDCLVF